MLGCDEGFQLAYEFESQPRVIAILAVVGPMTAFNETRAEFSNSPRACRGAAARARSPSPACNVLLLSGANSGAARSR